MSFLVLFWWKILFVFSNARSILELMPCNQNLTQLYILNLLNSNCRVWALKLSEHLKTKKTCFCLHFANSNSRIILPHFLSNFLFNISYPKSSLNLCDEYHFSSIKNCQKSGSKLDFSEKFNFPWDQLDAINFVFFTCMTQNQSGIIK